MTLADTYELVRPACVAISMVDDKQDSVRFLTFGSGACIDADGIVVTAKHVVTGYYEQLTGVPVVEGNVPAPRFRVLFSRRANERYEVFHVPVIHIYYAPSDYDVALLRIEPTQGGWPAMRLPQQWSVREGSAVATAGYPLRDWEHQNPIPHLFSGIVSQIGVWFHDGIREIRELQLDISIHPGNSGGPVFDVDTGKLVGIIASQRLRELDVVELLNSQADQGDGGETSKSQLRVWTNIAQCVPWTAIPRDLGFLKE